MGHIGMRILFICQFFAPDITAAAFRMSDFARLMSDAGDEVCVITSEPHKVKIGDVDDAPYAAAGIRILRCPLNSVQGRGARAYLAHYMRFVVGSLWLGVRVWREGWRPDIIYASSPPLFVGITGRVLAKLFGCPMVFEVRDVWPDAAVSAGQLRPGGRAYRWGRRLERYLYRKADHITCVAEPMREYLIQETKTPVTVVYNGIDLDSSPSVLPDRATAARPLKTLLYAGNLGLVQQLDILLRGLGDLKSRPELANWEFQLLGGGAQLESLRQLAEDMGISDRVRFLPPVPREVAAQLMSEADLLYLHLMGDSTMEKTIPSKLFDYLLAARPILAGLAGEGQQILDSTGANVVFPPGNLTELKSAVLKSIQSWDQLDRCAGRNRELALSRFTRQQAARVLRQVFETLVETTARTRP